MSLTLSRSEPGAFDVEGACAYLGGIGRTTLYALLRDGDLQAVKVRGRTVIPRAELDAYIDRLRADA